MDKPDNASMEAVETLEVSRRPRQLWLFPPTRPLVERFGAEYFRNLPARPGVYLMCGVREGVLYVGKARNLRRRIGSYRSANPACVPRKIRRLLAAVDRIYWDECNDETEAIARERELLLTLRPKFNTVGTYPAPRHYLGWQRSGTELLLGFGEATDEWENRVGGFTRLKPVYASLLRLLWRAFRPKASWSDLPSSLHGDDPPAVCRFRESRCASAALLSEVDQRLDRFLRGTSAEFPDRLLNLAPAGSRFEEQWREHDALCLREFFERQFGSGANHRRS